MLYYAGGRDIRLESKYKTVKLAIWPKIPDWLILRPILNKSVKMMDKPKQIILDETERAILDCINELRFTKSEKMGLIQHYFPMLEAETIFFFIDRIEFVEILKEYAERRQRSNTVAGYFGSYRPRFNGDN